MRQDNVVQEKSYRFSLRVVRLYQHLTAEKKEFVLSKQILKSGTSIGANIEEAIGGQTRKDFFAKICIAYKEARETHYWLRLLKDSDYLNKDLADSLIVDCHELLKIIGSIQKSIKQSNS
jgi:four helix bundle protein